MPDETRKSAPMTGLSFEELDHKIRLSPYSQWVGTELVSCADGKCEVRIDSRDELIQDHGFLHGSLYGYLADSACAWAAASAVGDCRTSEYKINLLAPGDGQYFVGRGEVVKVTRRMAVARADVFAVKDGVEKLIAIASATMMRVQSD